MSERVYVGVCGSRDYYPDDLMFASIERLAKKHPGLVIVTGDADGVDTCAVQTARMLHVPFVVETARWAEEGKPAGHNRNERVVAQVSSLLAFIAPKATYVTDVVAMSPGTADCITQAIAKPIPVHVYHGGLAKWLPDDLVRSIADDVQRKWRTR